MYIYKYIWISALGQEHEDFESWSSYLELQPVGQYTNSATRGCRHPNYIYTYICVYMYVCIYTGAHVCIHTGAQKAVRYVYTYTIWILQYAPPSDGCYLARSFVTICMYIYRFAKSGKVHGRGVGGSWGWESTELWFCPGCGCILLSCCWGGK